MPTTTRTWTKRRWKSLSYGITGSVSATNRGLKELRDEIATIDDKIASLIERGTVAGLHVKYPDYRLSPFGGLQ